MFHDLDNSDDMLRTFVGREMKMMTTRVVLNLGLIYEWP